jgi:hypothetical protein
MPAWSVPGCQRVLKPSIRFMRIITSCRVSLRPWPMCSEPVTFGGGMTIAYGFLGEAGSARK